MPLLARRGGKLPAATRDRPVERPANRKRRKRQPLNGPGSGPTSCARRPSCAGAFFPWQAWTRRAGDRWPARSWPQQSCSIPTGSPRGSTIPSSSHPHGARSCSRPSSPRPTSPWRPCRRRGSTIIDIRQATLEAMRRAIRALCRSARLHPRGRARPAGLARPGRGRHQGRQAGRLHRRRLHRRKGHARQDDEPPRHALSRLRIRATCRLRHGRASQCAGEPGHAPFTA